MQLPLWEGTPQGPRRRGPRWSAARQSRPHAPVSTLQPHLATGNRPTAHARLRTESPTPGSGRDVETPPSGILHNRGHPQARSRPRVVWRGGGEIPGWGRGGGGVLAERAPHPRLTAHAWASDYAAGRDGQVSPAAGRDRPSWGRWLGRPCCCVAEGKLPRSSES